MDTHLNDLSQRPFVPWNTAEVRTLKEWWCGQSRAKGSLREIP